MKFGAFFENPRRRGLPGTAPYMALRRGGLRLPVPMLDIASVPWGLRLRGDIEFINLAPVTWPVATTSWGRVDAVSLHRSPRGDRPFLTIPLYLPVEVTAGCTLSFLPGQLVAKGMFRCQTSR